MRPDSIDFAYGYSAFKEIAKEVESTLVDSWIVGHNVRFDVGFMAMASVDRQIQPLGCLDICQLAKAICCHQNNRLPAARASHPRRDFEEGFISFTGPL